MPTNCPACGSALTRDARLYASDGLLRKLFYSPRRCRSCRHRFWQRNLTKQIALVTLLVTAIGIAVLSVDTRSPPAPVERVSALDRLTLRANNGDPEAQFQLGMRHLAGDGVAINLAEANRLFERAAREGNVEAQFQYGVSLLQGRGLVQDYKTALRWIEGAAKRGHPKAQVRLAEMYRYGNGVAQSKPRAYLWFNLAAAQGDEVAVRLRDSIAAQLKPHEVEAMQKAAQKMSEDVDAAEAIAAAELAAKAEAKDETGEATDAETPETPAPPPLEDKTAPAAR